MAVVIGRPGRLLGRVGAWLASAAAGPWFVAFGAALAVVSGLAPWVRVLGDDLAGYRMADLVLSLGDDLEVTPPRWVGVAWYLIPIAGSVAWIATFWSGVAVRPRYHLPAAVVISVVTLALAVAVARTVTVSLGPGVVAGGSSGLLMFWGVACHTRSHGESL